MRITRAPRDPRPGSQRLRGALLGGALFLVSGAGSAVGSGREKIHIEYSAAVSCPNAHEFEVLVRELSSKIEITKKQSATRRFIVTLRTEPSGAAVGQLELAGDAPSSSRRDFRSASCGEVAEALALALALVVDPELSGAEPSGDEPRGDEPSRPVEIELEESPEQEPPSKPAERATASASKGARAPWLGAQAVLGGAFWGDAPRLEAGLGLTLWGGEPLPHSSLHLEISGARLLDEGPNLSLTWLPNARLSLCPHGLPLSDALLLSLCGGAELGVLRSRAGTGLEPLAEAERPWSAALLELRLRWRSSPVLFELRGGASVPLVKQSYWAASNGGDVLLLEIGPSPQAFFALAGYFELL